MSTGSPPPNPQRGEIWWVNFMPQKGHEVIKKRPALVIGEPKLGEWSLRIVVPIFTERGHYKKLPWFVLVSTTAKIGLEHDGEVDASQVKSLSIERFGDKMGEVPPAVLDEVVEAVVLCLGYNLPS